MASVSMASVLHGLRVVTGPLVLDELEQRCLDAFRVRDLIES